MKDLICKIASFLSIISIIFVIAIFFFSFCSFILTPSDPNSTDVISSNETNNPYTVWISYSTQEYLDLLNQIDKEGYELVDISRNEYRWVVTYKCN